MTVVYRSSIGHVSVTYQLSIDGGILYRLTRLSVDISADSQPTVDRLSIDSLPIGGRLSADYRLIVCRQSTDIAVDIAADISTEATYSTHDPRKV